MLDHAVGVDVVRDRLGAAQRMVGQKGRPRLLDGNRQRIDDLGARGVVAADPDPSVMKAGQHPRQIALFARSQRGEYFFKGVVGRFADRGPVERRCRRSKQHQREGFVVQEANLGQLGLRQPIALVSARVEVLFDRDPQLADRRDVSADRPWMNAQGLA